MNYTQIVVLQRGWIVVGHVTRDGDELTRMVDHIAPTLFDLLGWMGVRD